MSLSSGVYFPSTSNPSRCLNERFGSITCTRHHIASFDCRIRLKHAAIVSFTSQFFSFPFGLQYCLHKGLFEMNLFNTATKALSTCLAGPSRIVRRHGSSSARIASSSKSTAIPGYGHFASPVRKVLLDYHAESVAQRGLR